jgi:hypothetical protein
MNWKLWAVVLGWTTFVMAQGPKGTTPRSDAAAYPAHAEAGGVAVGASLLTPDEVHRTFVSDVNRCCLVVEVAFFPPKDKPFEVSLNDLVLKIKDTRVATNPSSARVVAASLEKKERSGRDITVSPSQSITYQTGRGYDPVTSTQGNGVTHTTGAVVGIGRPGSSPASIAMETELDEKSLPEGPTSTPVAGYVYFPIASKKKNATWHLEYNVGGQKIVVSLP